MGLKSVRRLSILRLCFNLLQKTEKKMSASKGQMISTVSETPCSKLAKRTAYF